MKFNEKLRSLRLERGMTQETVAEQLGVSAQSVSKWERGLLSPDIHLLPKIAVLYRTSIDFIFEMDVYRDEQYKAEFRSRIHTLLKQKDAEAIYRAYIEEIERVPDVFGYYPEVMLGVLRAKQFDENRIARLIRLSDYADLHCENDDIRNEIHRLMLQICSHAEHPAQREHAKKYYMQLSLLRHSREIYAQYVMDGPQYRTQLQETILRCVDIAECAVRQMLSPDMPARERRYYYTRAAALYEAVLDGGFGGFYDIPLLCDYRELVRLCTECGDTETAETYIGKMLSMMEAITDPAKQPPTSVFVADPAPKHHTSAQDLCRKVLLDIINDASFGTAREALAAIAARVGWNDTDEGNT